MRGPDDAVGEERFLGRVDLPGGTPAADIGERPGEEPVRFRPAADAPGEQVSVPLEDVPWHEQWERSHERPALGVGRRPDRAPEVRLAELAGPEGDVRPVHPADRVDRAARRPVHDRLAPGRAVGRQPDEGIPRVAGAGRFAQAGGDQPGPTGEEDVERLTREAGALVPPVQGGKCRGGCHWAGRRGSGARGGAARGGAGGGGGRGRPR